MPPSVRVKLGLASRHFTSAKIQRDKMKQIEASYNYDRNDVTFEAKKKHQSAFLSSIFCVTAAVECYANEFADRTIEEYVRRARGRDKTSFKDLDFSTLEMIAKYRNKTEKYDNKAKEEIAYYRASRSLNKILDILEEDKFDVTQDPQFSVDRVFTMRNKLYHHKPRWVEGGPKDYTENEYGIEDDLNGKFELNPFMPPGNAFFPSQCTSASCATWAIDNVSNLLNSFTDRIGHDKHFHKEKYGI